MDFKAEQEKFDLVKWYDSIVAGEDRCGSYEFCENCDKTETEPCAKAALRSSVEAEPTFAPAEEALVVEEEPAFEASKRLYPLLTLRLRLKKK